MSDQETTTAATSSDGSLSRRFLVIVGDGVMSMQPLPDAGTVTIGRDESCDVVIAHKSVSRKHAILSLGATVLVEDLGSANGTRVRDRRIEPNSAVTMPPNEPVEVGSVLVIVRERPSWGHSRHIWAHGYFEERLEEECARAGRQGGQFGVTRVRALGANPSEVEEGVLAVLRVSDIVGRYGPMEYEVLLPDTPESDLPALVARIRQALAGCAAEVLVGSAWFPKDGRDPYALLARGAPTPRFAVVRATNVDAVDSVLLDLHRLVDRVAGSPISVLISGETGVGKELIAQRIHRHSPQASGQFLGINCGALSESLLESELFGHEKGAFTGAVQAKPGLFEVAKGGTVFLDEVGELTLPIQVKLLRVIEERMVLRVGGLTPRKIDVRFVAATNRDLEVQIAKGCFREDLYFRLNGMSIDIPPLRRRLQEIPTLARLFIAEGAERMGLASPGLSTEAIDVLMSYWWPGNIRELRNVMERAMLLSDGAEIRTAHLPTEKMSRRLLLPDDNRGENQPATRSSLPHRPVSEPRRATRDIDSNQILEALAKSGGNQKRAAELLGVSRRSLINRINELDLPRPRKR